MIVHCLKKYGILFLLTVLVSPIAFAQTGVITGRVVDETNQPMPGVSILVEGSTLGTQTNVNGEFRLNGVSFGNVSVTAKFIGYQSLNQQIKLSSATVSLNFNLQPISEGLNEVVVIGYGSVSKKDLTGSVSTVTSKDFQKGTITSPDQLIQGKVAGVTITNNGGQPGAGATIRIRGGASLNASNDPLIVVDGNPLSGDGPSGNSNVLALINPNDIESFTILKDANATAIYGSRASNGVILITTKKGQSGKPVFNFSTNNSLGTIAKKTEVLSAQEVRDYVAANGTAEENALLGTANTNWQDQIFQNAFATDNNLSVAGAIKNMPYRISGGYINQEGILKTDKMQRGTAGINLSPKFFDNHLKVDLNVKGSLSKSRFGNQGAIGAAIMYDPTQEIYNDNLPFGGYNEWTVSSVDNGVTKIVPNSNAPRNPLGLLNNNINEGNTKRSFGNLQLDYSFHFLPELHANVNLGYDVAKGEGNTFIPEYAASNFGTSGSDQDYGNKINNYFVEAYLNYIKDLKSINSNINATAGYGVYDNKVTNYNFIQYNALGTVLSTPNYPFDIQQNRMLSVYGRLIYTLSDKYILSGTIRSDGSSKFGEDTRWGYFPSAAFTWRIKQENFLKDNTTLSDLKLRLSYGVTGNKDGIANYSYIPIYTLTSGESQYLIGNEFYQTYTPIAYDPELQWETTDTYNAGVDFGFLNGRITASIDAYYKKTKDLLAVVEIPVGTNFSNQLLTNVGNMENKGVEFNLNVAAIKQKDFSWDFGFNATYNKNEITKLSLVQESNVPQAARGITGGTGNNIQYHAVGYAPFAFYVYKQVYDTNGKPLEGVYADLNNDGTVSSSDMYLYKSPAPKVILGFNTAVNVKQWTFNTVLRANLGNYIYDNLSSDLGVKRNIINPVNIINNAGRDFYNTNFTNNQYSSDYYVKNASFLKMDNLGVAYRFNEIKKGSNANLTVSANCQNIFVISNYKGIDPENFTGIDYTLYPRPRTFTLGLNVQF